MGNKDNKLPEDSEENDSKKKIDRKEFLKNSLHYLTGAATGIFYILNSQKNLFADSPGWEDAVWINWDNGSSDWLDEPGYVDWYDRPDWNNWPNYDDTCSPAWVPDHWEAIDSERHHLIERDANCGEGTRPVAGSSEPHLKDRIIGHASLDNSKHYTRYKCSKCLYEPINVAEYHYPHSVNIDNNLATATVTCVCGYSIVRNLPSLFVSQAYTDLLKTLLYTGYDSNPLHSSEDGNFVYRTLTDNAGNPFFYISKGGKFSFSVKKQNVDDFFSSMYKLEAFGQEVSHLQFSALSRYDRLYYYQDEDYQLIYERDRTTGNSYLTNLLANGITMTDDGDYHTAKELKFKEVNRNGITRYLTIKYRFSDVFPDLDVTAQTDNRALDNAGVSATSLATENNTIYSLFVPTFTLSYRKKGSLELTSHDILLNPLDSKNSSLNYNANPLETRASYRLDKWHEDNWASIAADISSLSGYATGGTSLKANVVSSEGDNSLINAITNAGYNTNLLSKYKLTVYVRNIIGNLKTFEFYFFLDNGVEVDPRILWLYNLPTNNSLPPEEKVFGKQNAELDFEAINAKREEYPIVSVRVYDQTEAADGKGYLAMEGFRGALAGTALNKAGVFIMKNPNLALEESLAANNLIPAIPGNLLQDAERENKNYYPFTLEYKHFLNQHNQNYATAKMLIERVTIDNNKQVVTAREVQVPTNVWNVPFKTKLVFRDWIGNSRVFPDDNAGDSLTIIDGFELNIVNKNEIYTPAFCPDIDITSVYITGNSNEVSANPALALNPAKGMLLDIMALPAFRAFSAIYNLQVEDENKNIIFTSESNNTQGNAVHIKSLLRYEYRYVFLITANNANGYTTEPANVFTYLFSKKDLAINRSGALKEDEDWNWHYRLIGDVIIPNGIRLRIIPGGKLTMPELPAVYADRRAKLITKAGGTLIIDGAWKDNSPFNPSANYLNKDSFLNLVPSGLDARLNAGGAPETIYRFDGVNNWGGIYFEKGYSRDSYIRRARICGAFDGVLIFGNNNSGEQFIVADSLLLSNYIGLHALSESKVKLSNSIIDSNLEYGIKTDGKNYKIILENIITFGPANKFADYYSTKLYRRLPFTEVQSNITISNTEGGN